MDSLSPPLLPVTATKSADAATSATTIDTTVTETPMVMVEQTAPPSSTQAPSLSISEQDYDVGAIYRQVAAIRKAQSQMLSHVERPTPLSLRLAMGQVAGSVQQAEKALDMNASVNLSATASDLALKKANRVSTFYTQSALETRAHTNSTAASQLVIPETTTLIIESVRAQASETSSQVTTETNQHSALDRAREAYGETEHVTPDN